MDNIQKLILGVLGVSGMLAMLVPSGATVRPKSDPMSVAVSLPVSEPVSEPVGINEDGSVDEDEVVEESEFNDEDVFLTGEPAIDGNPAQGQQSSNSDTPQQPVEQYVPPAIDYGQANLIPGPVYPTPIN